MRILIGAACGCIIAAAGYFFVQEYRTGAAAAKVSTEAHKCQLAAIYRTQVPELYRLIHERCGI